MVSTLTVDSQYVKKNKKEKLVFPLYRKYVEKLKFEKLKSMLIASVQRHFRNETEEEKAYGTSFLECVGSDEKFRYSFIRALKATMDIFSMKPFDKKDFAYLDGKVLVLIPENDMFEKEDSKKLADIFTSPAVKTTYGGHLGLVMRPEPYIDDMKEFLKTL